MWSSASDEVAVEALVRLQEEAGARRVYLDLPEDQRAEFDALRPSNGASAGPGVGLALATLALVL